MIQEAYCSFEVSKLLKEKGFPFNEIVAYKTLVDSNGNEYRTITHQMAMAWLREVHNIAIVIKPAWAEGDMRNSVLWRWETVDMETIKRDYNGVIYQFSYEEAVEAALFYTLKNLI